MCGPSGTISSAAEDGPLDWQKGVAEMIPIKKIRITEKEADRLAALGQGTPTSPVGTHLTDVEFAEYSAGEADGDQKARIDWHLLSCEQCCEEMIFLITESSAWETPEGRTRIQENGDALIRLAQDKTFGRLIPEVEPHERAGLLDDSLTKQHGGIDEMAPPNEDLLAQAATDQYGVRGEPVPAHVQSALDFTRRERLSLFRVLTRLATHLLGALRLLASVPAPLLVGGAAGVAGVAVIGIHILTAPSIVEPQHNVAGGEGTGRWTPPIIEPQHSFAGSKGADQYDWSGQDGSLESDLFFNGLSPRHPSRRLSRRQVQDRAVVLMEDHLLKQIARLSWDDVSVLGHSGVEPSSGPHSDAVVHTIISSASNPGLEVVGFFFVDRFGLKGRGTYIDIPDSILSGNTPIAMSLAVDVLADLGKTAWLGQNGKYQNPQGAGLPTSTSSGRSVSLPNRWSNIDAGDTTTSIWNGAFTTQINGMTPLQIRNVIAGGGSITNSFSGELDIFTVPEPDSMVMLVFGVIVLAAAIMLGLDHGRRRISHED
jgi:hypothetical protein